MYATYLHLISSDDAADLQHLLSSPVLQFFVRLFPGNNEA